MDAKHARLVLPTVATLALTLIACGDDESSPVDPKETSVENASIIPAFDTSCALQIDAPAQLSFTATNNSSTTVETLLDISTPAASDVEITAPAQGLRMRPQTSISAGQPIQNTDEPTAPDQPFAVSLRGVKDPVQPGRSVPVEFQFERAGSLTVDVAVDACPPPDLKPSR